MRASFLLSGIVVCVAGGVAQAQLTFVPGNSNVTGVASGQSTDNASMTEHDAEISSMLTETPTLYGGQTGGGILETQGMNLEQEVSAEIVNSLLGTEIHYHALNRAQFDTANFTGSISSASTIYLQFILEESASYSIITTGSLPQFSLTTLLGITPITGSGTLDPGTYEIFQNLAIDAGTGMGQTALEEYEGTWTLYLNGGVPSPGTVSMILAALGVVGYRRRR